MARSWRGRHHARMRRQYTSEQRSELIRLVTGGQATASEAATRLGVAPATAYYWLKRRNGTGGGTQGPKIGTVADKGAEMTFMRLVPNSPRDATLAVRVGRAEVVVREGFDSSLLRAVVTALLESTP